MNQVRWEFFVEGDLQQGFELLLEPKTITLQVQNTISQNLGNWFLRRYLLHGLQPNITYDRILSLHSRISMK